MGAERRTVILACSFHTIKLIFESVEGKTSINKCYKPTKCADKSLARPGSKQATATEDFYVFIYPIYNHNWRNISTIYMTSIILTIKQNTSGSKSG